jgi:hypothetical protein
MPRGGVRKIGGDALLQSAELIGWALGGLEREIVGTRERLGALTAQLAKLRARAGRRATVGGTVATTVDTPASVRRGRRRMSAEVRARLLRLAKERWAKAKRAGKKRL